MTTVRGVATIAGIAVFGAVSAAVLAPTASANDTWYTVMAYSPSTGAIGWSTNYPTLEDAAARAMQECENHPTHPSDCRFVDGSYGPSCVALVVSPDRTIVEGAIGRTRDDANAAALSEVPGGTVLGTTCSYGKGAPNGGSAP